MSHRIILLPVLFFAATILKAQDTSNTHITYDLTTEVAVGTGDYTAYQLVTNRHHTLGTRQNTAYMRGAVNIEHSLSKDWTLSDPLLIQAMASKI